MSIKKVYFSEFFSEKIFKKYENKFSILNLEENFIKEAKKNTDLYLNKNFIISNIEKNNVLFIMVVSNMDIDYYTNKIKEEFGEIEINLILEKNSSNVNKLLYNNIVII